MSEVPKCKKKNDSILVNDNNKKTSNNIRKSLITILFLIIVYSVGLSAANAMPMESFVGSDTCGNCHVAQFDEWNQTAHSQAFTDPEFQAQWIAQGSPSVCVSCHTTNYKESSEEFEFEGVGCEMCHTPRGENSMTTPATSCGDCHSVSHYPTYTEWLESEHSHNGVGCDSCHDPMTLEIRTKDPNTLCKTCHNLNAVEVEVEEHGMEGYECLDCHMTTSLVDFENAQNGMTGHSFLPAVPDPDCSSCHDVSLDAHTIWGATNENCMTCHDDVFMTMLHLLNGTDVAISESSVLCAQCHNDVYYEWSLGIHAETHDVNLVCIDCHAPMNPYIMMDKTLPPVTALAQVEDTHDPIISPTFFFIAIIGALGATIYVFVVRRT